MIQVNYWDVHSTIKSMECVKNCSQIVDSILQVCGFQMPKKIFKEFSYVAFVEQKPVAILLSSPSQRAPIPRVGQSLYIDQIAVLPEMRSRGLGTYLMTHFMTQWALCMDIHLDCFEDWLENFQKDFGFEVIGRRAEIHDEPELRTSMLCKSWTFQSPQLKDHMGLLVKNHRDGTLVLK